MGLTALALIAVVLHEIAMFQVRQQGSDSDQRWTALDMVAASIEDYYWWEGVLPTSYTQIAPIVSRLPKEWRPLRNSTIHWRLVQGTQADPEGGLLNLLEITSEDPGLAPLVRILPVDLRDPNKLWKPHYTSMDTRFPIESLARTTPNLAQYFAKAVYDRLESSGASLCTLDEAMEAKEIWKSSGGEASKMVWPASDVTRAQRDFELAFVGDGFHLKHLPSDTVFRFPRSGPKAVNAGVAPVPVPMGS